MRYDSLFEAKEVKEEKEPKKVKKAWELIIPGLFNVIVAIISLIGGLLLKEPLAKIVQPHCKIGGVWKPHGTNTVSCDINLVGHKFYIQMENSVDPGIYWILKGEGEDNGTTSDFSAEITFIQEKSIFGGGIANKKTQKIKGIVSMQGCDGLGVTLLDVKDLSQKGTIAFIREALEMKANPNEK